MVSKNSGENTHAQRKQTSVCVCVHTCIWTNILGGGGMDAGIPRLFEPVGTFQNLRSCHGYTTKCLPWQEVASHKTAAARSLASQRKWVQGRGCVWDPNVKWRYLIPPQNKIPVSQEENGRCLKTPPPSTPRKSNTTQTKQTVPSTLRGVFGLPIRTIL